MKIVVCPGAFPLMTTCDVPTGTAPAMRPSPTATRVSPSAFNTTECPDWIETSVILIGRTGSGVRGSDAYELL